MGRMCVFFKGKGEISGERFVFIWKKWIEMILRGINRPGFGRCFFLFDVFLRVFCGFRGIHSVVLEVLKHQR